MRDLELCWARKRDMSYRLCFAGHDISDWLMAQPSVYATTLPTVNARPLFLGLVIGFLGSLIGAGAVAGYLKLDVRSQAQTPLFPFVVDLLENKSYNALTREDVVDFLRVFSFLQTYSLSNSCRLPTCCTARSTTCCLTNRQQIKVVEFRPYK